MINDEYRCHDRSDNRNGRDRFYQFIIFFMSVFEFGIPTVHATGLADVGNNYSAGEMITTGVAIVVFVAVLCAVLFIVW